MPTEIVRRPYVSPYGASEPAYTDANLAEEAAIMSEASLVHWFRASDGFGEAGWTCRKTGKVAGPKRNDTLPTRMTSGTEYVAYNNKAVLKFGSTNNFNGAMQLEDGFVTDADYSLVFVAHAPASASHQVFLADDQTSLATTFRQVASTDDFDGRHAGALIIGPTGTLVQDGPNLIIVSYRKSDKLGKLYINGVEAGTYRTDRGEILNGNLQIGSAGDTSATTPILNGCFAELMVFSEPIHLNTDLFDLITDTLTTRYGV